MSGAKAVVATSQGYLGEYGTEKGQFEELKTIGNNLTQGVEGRLAWLKVLKAINLVIPRDFDPNVLEKPVEEREELHVTEIHCIHADSLDMWYNGRKMGPQAGGDSGGSMGGGGDEVYEDSAEMEEAPAEETDVQPPTGSGWVFRITGYHYHNKPGDTATAGDDYVRQTLMHNLKQKRLPLPPGEKLSPELQTTPDQTDFPVGELGIGFPFLIDPPQIEESTLEAREGLPLNPEPNAAPIEVRVFDFVVEFCWQPKTAEEDEEGADGDVAFN
jgi:hypothetical protein